MTNMAPDSTASPPSPPPQSEPSGSPTPYLDLELPLPAPNWAYRPIAPWQTALILAAFLLRTPFEVYLLILAVALVHELGHCLAGLAAGMKFDTIRVGPIAIDSYKRLNWEWNRGMIIGGDALMLPRTMTAARWAPGVFIAGGPAANVVSGLIALRLLPIGSPHFAGLAQLFVAGSFVVGLGNLVPFRRYGFGSDGMKLLLLFSKEGRRWIFLLNRRASVTRGEPTREEEIEPIFTTHSNGSSD